MEAPSRTFEQAKKLRKGMSLPEVLLWQALRRERLGLKFRRQHPEGPFILDFYCAKLRLAVEIDGSSHGAGDRPQRDNSRDGWLKHHGIAVVRLQARTVLRDMNAALAVVVGVAEERRRDLPPPPASRGAPP